MAKCILVAANALIVCTVLSLDEMIFAYFTP